MRNELKTWSTCAAQLHATAMSLMDFLEFELHLSFNRLNQHAENFFFNYATTTILNNFNQNL